VLVAPAQGAVGDRGGRGILDAAAELAETLGHPVHDCLYLALAIREGVQMVAAHRRFVAAVETSATLSQSVRLLDA
jgi:predicted nucleic acid-binding protein